MDINSQKILRFIFVGFILLVLFLGYIGGLQNQLASLIRSSFKIGSLETVAKLVNKSLTGDQAVEQVNKIRREKGLTELIENSSYCEETSEIYFEVDGASKISVDDICPECSAVGYIEFENRYFSDENFWFEDDETIGMLTENYDHLCAIEKNEFMLIALYKNPAPQALITRQPAVIETASSIPITEQQLWDALVSYRQAHTKPDLQQSEKLCVYARERVEEHIQMLNTKTIEEYPNQSKYPLDNHAGFISDGESGYLFTTTEFNVVAENLAYWPTAQYASQVIEWGWDTSTEGHREAQLSTDYTHACLSGRNGFFVAIFGRH
jgi:uncharacterized protein YkwD